MVGLWSAPATATQPPAATPSQVNGGSVAEKVDFGYQLFEKAVTVDTVVGMNEMVDTIAITKGKGTEGVVTRWGVSRLPRKTHRGLRKVGCIGAWHPSAVKWTVPRSGQHGFHHRTELNKKVYRVGKAGEESHKAATDYDMTEKVTPPRATASAWPSRARPSAPPPRRARGLAQALALSLFPGGQQNTLPPGCNPVPQRTLPAPAPGERTPSQAARVGAREGQRYAIPQSLHPHRPPLTRDRSPLVCAICG